MRVLAVTKIFPNALEPLSAPFNRQQLAALGRRCDVRVLATIPWFPGAGALARWSPTGRLSGLPRAEVIDGLPVEHPRTLFVPRVGHAASAALYAASVLPALLRHRGSFDVLLGSWAYPDGVAAVMLGRALRIPTVIKLHGSDIDVLAGRRALRAQIRLALGRADRVVAVSRALAEKALVLGARPDRVDVVMNGVDATVFHPRDRSAARAELGHAAAANGDARRFIVYVGRLTREKGILDLAAAFAALAESRPDVVLALVGDGSERAEVAARLAPFASRVIFAGARPLAEVPLWMGAADLVTLPSHHEGTPNVLLEALACGRRVVATRVGGIPDVIHSPELGVLVEVGDVAALGRALGEVASAPYDPAAVAELGARGGWDESAARLHASLGRAVEQTAAAPRSQPHPEDARRVA
jgi:teichuronic acid biosynthesis glycosyltransferase TuaC